MESSSGLADEEIDKMVQDAEKHADEDKKKTDLIAGRNEADQLVYSTEKTLKEAGDKISEEEKTKIEEASKKLQEALSGESLETINKAKEELMAVSHKLAEEMYKQAQQEQAGTEAGTAQPEAEPETGGGSKSDGAVEADFEVVDAEDDKK